MIEYFVFICGFALAVHMICTAAKVPEHTPLLFAIFVATGFSSGVGMIVAAVTRNTYYMIMFASSGVAALLCISLYLWTHGYYVSAFIAGKFCCQRRDDTVGSSKESNCEQSHLD